MRGDLALEGLSCLLCRVVKVSSSLQLRVPAATLFSRLLGNLQEVIPSACGIRESIWGVTWARTFLVLSALLADIAGDDVLAVAVAVHKARADCPCLCICICTCIDITLLRTDTHDVLEETLFVRDARRCGDASPLSHVLFLLDGPLRLGLRLAFRFSTRPLVPFVRESGRLILQLPLQSLNLPLALETFEGFFMCLQA